MPNLSEEKPNCGYCWNRHICKAQAEYLEWMSGFHEKYSGGAFHSGDLRGISLYLNPDTCSHHISTARVKEMVHSARMGDK